MFDVKKVDDKSGIIMWVMFKDCIFEKFFVLGLLIFNEGIFLRSNCFNIIVDFEFFDVKFSVIL